VAAQARAQTAWRVVFASSLGTVFEWYDFYLYGSLAVFFGGLFFPPGNETAALLASLATFGAGFAVRPFGAVLFGRAGDTRGRKRTFVLTTAIMGAATALVGVLPTYDQVGIVAPVALLALRLLQGLALGGEYGGAATYVAEHAPPGRRGLHTAFIQTTATLGFLLSIAVILATRHLVGEAAFRVWGWRVPFVGSLVLVAVSAWMRHRLRESPIFAELLAEGRTSRRPIAESFGRWRNLRVVLVAIFGLTAGQAVVWYTGQFYALLFLQDALRVPADLAYGLVAVALVLGTPLFLVFGALSDRLGRKRLIMAGCFLAATTYLPIFRALGSAANPALIEATRNAPVVVFSQEADDPSAAFLTRRGVPYARQAAMPGAPVVSVGGRPLAVFDTVAYARALATAGYPATADPARVDRVRVVLLLVLLVLYVSMVYGPMAAYLAELFPTRIRYTSLSVPYHVGNGWFGGFLPLIAEAVVVRTGDPYAGLLYPVIVALVTALVGGLLLRETAGVDLRAA
jgi:MFS family permease